MSIYAIKLFLFFKVTSLEPGQSYDCPGASEVNMKDMCKISQCLSHWGWAGDAYVRHWTKPLLFQVMVCCLFGAKPLPASMMIYCQLGSYE